MVYFVVRVASPIFGRFYAVLPVAASKIGFLSVIGSPGFSMHVHHTLCSMYVLYVYYIDGPVRIDSIRGVHQPLCTVYFIDGSVRVGTSLEVYHTQWAFFSTENQEKTTQTRNLIIL